jgi:ABC-type nitrate/sulfonate/bicarbonate transport system substrate-binding protein
MTSSSMRAMGRALWVVAAACVSLAAHAADLQKLEVSVGRLPWGALNSPITTLMVQKGMFEEEARKLGYDVKVDLRDYPSALPQIQAMQAGKLDLGVWGDTPVIRAIATGQSVRVLALAEGHLDFWIAVPKGSPIHTLEDLKGKRIGTLLGGDPHFFLAMVLKAQFGTADPTKLGITMVNVPSFTMLATMPKGLDAVTLITPSYLLGVQQGVLEGLVDNFGRTGPAYDGPLGKGAGHSLPSFKKSQFYPEGYYLHRTMWVGRNDFIDKHPKVVEAFLAALNRATHDISKMDAGAVSNLVENYWKLPPDQGSVIVKDDVLYSRGWTWLTEGDLYALVANSQFMKEANLLPKELTWPDIVKNISPVASIEAEAWKRSGIPPVSEFTRKAEDLRGVPMWDYKDFSHK